MKTFTLNGNEYQAKQFDFNLVCDLEDMGVPIANASNRPTSFLRAYIGLCIGKGKEFAGKEIEQHLMSGNNLDEVSEIIAAYMEESDFFRSFSKTESQEVAANTEEEK